MATLTELQERLALYKQAETAILTGAQEYQVGKRRLTRANLAEVQRAIADLEMRISSVGNNGLFGHSVTVFGGRR